jgi:hypothetical protein
MLRIFRQKKNLTASPGFELANSLLGLVATVNKCEQEPFLYMNYKVMPEGINGDDITLRTIILKASAVEGQQAKWHNKHV